MRRFRMWHSGQRARYDEDSPPRHVRGFPRNRQPAILRASGKAREQATSRRVRFVSLIQLQVGSGAMAVTVHIPSVLRGYCEGASALSLDAPSVRAALAAIAAAHPRLYRSICDETGAVRRHLERVREHRPHPRPGRDSTRRSRPATSSPSCPRSQEVEHGRARRPLHRHQEGSVRRRGGEGPRRRFALRGPFGAGVPVYSTLIDTRGTPRSTPRAATPSSA